MEKYIDINWDSWIEIWIILKIILNIIFIKKVENL